MWHRQNEYNTPSAQMARLREAGLNPNLVYGSGSVTGNTSGQTPKYQSVKTDFSKRQALLPALAMLGQFQNFQMKQAQIDTAQAERDITELQRNVMLGKIPSQVRYPPGHPKAGQIQSTEVRMRPYMGVLADTQLEVQRATLNRILHDTQRIGVGTDIDRIRRDFEEWMRGFGVAGKATNILRTLFGKR